MNSIVISDIDIEIIKKKIKNIHLSVHPSNGRVRLAVPEKMGTYNECESRGMGSQTHENKVGFL